MTGLKSLILATALAGSVAVASAAPAAAQDVGVEDLIIPGLLVAGGLLAYQAYEDSQNDNNWYWRDGRRYYGNPPPANWAPPPPPPNYNYNYGYAPPPAVQYRYVPPPRQWQTNNGKPWRQAYNKGYKRGWKNGWQRGNGHDGDRRRGHGYGHRNHGD